jgi:hypothetical protein
MKFIPREMSWFKRRTPTAEEMAVKKMDVAVIGFEKIHNHECVMIVEYDNGDVYELSGRVHLNHLATPNRWTVQGLNATGISVIVDVVDD